MHKNKEKAYLPESGDNWFCENTTPHIEPCVYEEDYDRPVLYDHEGNALTKPKERIGFKLWKD